MQLASWTYTKEEWNRFLHWKNRERGLVFAFLQKWVPRKTNSAPEVKIALDRVWVNQVHEPFQNLQRQFREIHIRDEGNINILEIRYEQGNSMHGIRVPIPKGKLREAFEIQERLVLDNESIS